MNNTPTKRKMQYNVQKVIELQQPSKKMKYNPLINNFIKIINSLKPDTSQKYLEFTDNTIHPFQFPNKRIYIRNAYKEMFINICKCLEVLLDIFLTRK